MTNPDARRAEIAENLRLVRARIDDACRAAGRTPDEVSLIAVTTFFPVTDAVQLVELAVAELLRLADRIAALPSLRLAGVMAIAPLDADPDLAFARLAAAAATLRATHPAAGLISAGMSDDLEAAVRHGSTHVRVGTALL